MIMQNIALILAIIIPAALLILLRTNAAIVFLSLCAGALLVKFAGNEASLVGSAIGNNSLVVSQYFEVALLLLPVLLSAILLRKSMSGPKGVLNLLPAVAVGLVGVLLAVPLLPSTPQNAITSLNGWSMLEQSKEIVVVAGALVSLIALWVTHPKGHGRHKRHGH
ncbi:MAG: hypothetical protein ABIQ89_00550 [Candidatus Saccharimonadales bacterium]